MNLTPFSYIEALAATVKHLRNKQGLTQLDLAFKAGVDRRYMSDLENAKRNPSMDVLQRIAAAFGLPISGFMHLVENAVPDHSNLETLKERLCQQGLEDAVVFENPDYADAVVGISNDDRVVYSFRLMVNHLVAFDGMTDVEAVDFIDYNTIGALPYMGEKAPIILYDLD